MYRVHELLMYLFSQKLRVGHMLACALSFNNTPMQLPVYLLDCFREQREKVSMASGSEHVQLRHVMQW
jgi:hypothetical protein